MTESGGRSRPWWRQARPEKWWWISLVVGIPVVLLTGIIALVLILTIHPTGDTAEIDLFKTALSVGAGTGGVVALVLTGRRQWHAEQAQRATDHDATERRITELYGKAVEQLGSEKAPVRLGGLYALERLAQDTPEQRQTIVAVISAYLRMPYELPGEPPEANVPVETRAEHRDRIEEQQVRLTAQHILTGHLSPDRPTFWPDTDLNLTGATLVGNIRLDGCRIRTAKFEGARFTGDASFVVTLTEYALFDRAQFTADGAIFEGAHFTGGVSFHRAVFTGGNISFDSVRFTDEACFDNVQFVKGASFGGAQFNGDVSFEVAEFLGDAWFRDAEFTDGVSFIHTQFTGEAWFQGAQFIGDATFGRAEFLCGFNRLSWLRDDSPCWVRLDHPERASQPSHKWPAGWTVKPTDDRPEGVTLRGTAAQVFTIGEPTRTGSGASERRQRPLPLPEGDLQTDDLGSGDVGRVCLPSGDRGKAVCARHQNVTRESERSEGSRGAADSGGRPVLPARIDAKGLPVAQ